MNKKLPGGPAAVIEIGSSAVRMRVSQLKHGEIEMLDSLEYPVFFGHEVFTTGRISFESLRQLSSILTKFTTALEGYNCKNVRVVSSTVMREAENRSFVIDQLKIHPGIGFGKTNEENFALIANPEKIRVPGTALLMAASRKRVIGAVCGNPPFEDRMAGTVAAHTASVLFGADMVRAHDTFEAVQAARVADAIKQFRK